MPKLQDPAITESSGCVIDPFDSDLFYTMNDENGPVYAVDRSSGKTVGKKGVNKTMIDPEGLALNRQSDNLFILDGGVNGNHDDRPTISLLWDQRFGRHYPGTTSWSRANFTFPGHAIALNSEALIINPLDGDWRYIITKTNPSRIYRTPLNIESGETYALIPVNMDIGISYVSDACFFPDANMVACVRSVDEIGSIAKKRVHYLLGDTFEYAGFDDFDEVEDPEGIGIAWDQKSLTRTSEGKYAYFKSNALPTALQPGPDFNPCSV